MTATLLSIAELKPNPHWASLPLFNRRDRRRFRFGDVVANVNERVESGTTADEIYVELDDLDSGSLDIILENFESGSPLRNGAGPA